MARGAGAAVRAVRLTFAQGSVTVAELEDEDGEGQAALVNMPLVAGTELLTGDDGQAEVEFEDGSVVRLTPNSTLALDSLTVDKSGVFSTGMTLLRGLAYAELRATAEYKYSLRAGGDALVPVENTTVRVNFDEPPPTFSVLDGTAEVARTDGSLRREVRAGETLRADADAFSYQLTQGIPEDTWDAWNSDRDRAEAAEAKDATGVRGDYAGAQGYGWSDLDANGTWYDVPGQGQVWQPSVGADAGFDPYGNGAWVWSGGGGAGYVWASGYGWGWTPYRCGNWSYFGGFGWGWSPAGCGGSGWRFWGGGRPVNIAIGPGGYRVPHVPHPHPGPVHPIVPGRLDGGAPVALAGQTGWGSAMQRGPRQGGVREGASKEGGSKDGGLKEGGSKEINGVAVNPVARTGAASLLAGSGAAEMKAGRSALERDFPVDRQSRTAIVGRVPMQPGMIRTDSGWRRDGEGGRPIGSAAGYTGQSGAPMYRNPSAEPGPGPRPVYRAPQDRGVQSGAPQGERPRDAGGQGQRPVYSGPAAGQTSRPYTPAPGQMSRPYTPAPGQMSRPYSPPPPPQQQQQMSRPYSPPAQAPVQHSAPPSPPPAASSGAARPSPK